MSDRPTPETDAAAEVWERQGVRHGLADLARDLERQRDELLEACINLENDDGAIDANSWNMIQAAVEKAGGKPKVIPLEVAREGYQLRLRMRETDALARELRDALVGLRESITAAKGITMKQVEAMLVSTDALTKAKEILL